MPSLQEMAAKRSRLNQALQMMTQMLQDMQLYKSEASLYCGYASAWAAVLMMADILRIALSAADPKAAAGFSAIDRGIEQANKLLVAFGRAPIQRKQDALDALDPSLKKVSTLTQQVQQTRDLLKKFGLKEGDKTGLVLDLAISMTDDTLLLLQPGILDQQLSRSSQGAINRTVRQIQSIRASLIKLDDQIQYLLYRHEQASRIA